MNWNQELKWKNHKKKIEKELHDLIKIMRLKAQIQKKPNENKKHWISQLLDISRNHKL